jgi:hypothetical protein
VRGLDLNHASRESVLQLEERLAKRADAVLTVSEPIAEKLRADLGLAAHRS